jgi:uncharacterized protein (TIGR03790 family)
MPDCGRVNQFTHGLKVTGALLIALGWAGIVRAADLAASVVIVANADDPGSLEIARHYAEARHVPEANIISLSMPQTETISWPEFIHTVWEPLLAELVRRDWIDAIAMKLTDDVGRTKYAVSGHRISFLVTCRGVPLRIMHDPSLYLPTLPFTEKTFFRTNAGAVDAELSLLARPDYTINAFVPNPLFNDDHTTRIETSQVVKVCRLDGPTVADAMQLVDRALAAEQNGLLGRAYVDIGGQGPEGDVWLESAAKQLEDLGFDTDVDRRPTTIPATARFDAPVIYLGWYTGTLNGPFRLPGFRFPPGAIALHIHSYSADSLRSAEANWCGPLIARGVTATVGNVFEPYLQLTHRPDLLLRALARGDCFGDAVYYAQPALSWETIAIGDPLYRPFAVSVDDQWAHRSTLSSRLGGYAVARKMKAAVAAHHDAEAIALGRSAQKEAPSLAVAFALAERLQAAGDARAAAATLSFLPLLGGYAADELALASQGAAILAAGGQPAAAVEVYRNILKTSGLATDVKTVWLTQAETCAASAGDQVQASSWKNERDRLAAETEAAKK